MFNKCSTWTTAFNFQAMASMLGCGILVGSSYKRDNQVLDGSEELFGKSVSLETGHEKMMMSRIRTNPTRDKMHLRL